MIVELRPHQRKAVEELDNGKILWGGVGTGKTITSLAYFFEKECFGDPKDLGSVLCPRDLYVITTAKKRDSFDWQDDAAKFNITSERTASVAGIQLTVDSWNNIDRYKEVTGAFFIFDEQRLVGSGAWVKAFIKIAKRNRWILLSATPGDTWLDYIPVFVANGFYKNRTEFKREHVVYNTFSKFPKVDRYLGVGKLIRYRNRLLVEMPYERHTTRHISEVPVQYDKLLFDKVVKERWHVYEDRPLRDVSELFSVMRKVVNTDSSRVRVIQDLLSTHPKLIVFYNFDYELEILRTLVPTEEDPWEWLLSPEGMKANESSPSSELISTASESTGSTLQLTKTRKSESEKSLKSSLPDSEESWVVAEWNGHKHEPIPDTDRWVYLVQYRAGAEGWNCIETDAMVFYSLTYSYRDFHQAHGRIDRLNTPFSDLYYYVLKSSSPIDGVISKALKNKKNFNESDFGIKL